MLLSFEFGQLQRFNCLQLHQDESDERLLLSVI